MRREYRWFSTARLLVLVSWCYVILPRLIQTLSAPKYRTAVSNGITQSHLSLLADRGLGLTLLALCAGIVLRRARNLPSDRGVPLLLLLAPWAAMMSRDVYLGTRPQIETLLYPAVVLAVWTLRPSLADLSLLGWLTGVTALIGMLIGVLAPSRGVLTAASGGLVAPAKEILPLGILVGPFSDGNNFGQFLVLGLPAVALVRNLPARALLSVLVTFAVVWTSSRSSLAAIGLAAVTAAMLGVRHPVTRRTLARLAVVATGAVLVALPLMTSGDGAFTNRGYIWRVSLRAWRDDPWLGHGSRWYSVVGQYVNALPSSAFHGHNQFVQTLVAGGLVYLVLTVGMFSTLVHACGTWALYRVTYPAIYLCVFFVSATLEVSFGVVDRGFLIAVTWLPMAFFAFADRRPLLPVIRVPHPGSTGTCLPLTS